MPTQLTNLELQAIKDALGQILPDQIMDVVWNEYFYYMTFFESLDGWGASSLYDWTGSAPDDGTQYWTKGVSYVTNGIVQVSAGPDPDQGTQIDKSPFNQPIISFDRPQRFRTQIKVVTVNEINAYAIIGQDISDGSDTTHYGFQIEETTLRGLCGDGISTNATVDLLTLSGGENLLLEARLLPNNKVTFYVSTTGIQDLKEYGTLTSPLPTGDFIYDADIFSTWALFKALAKANASDQGDWTTATAYAVDDVVFEPAVNMYFICISAHTSDISTAPPVGGSWEDKWEYFGIHISFFEYVQRKPQRAQRALS